MGDTVRTVLQVDGAPKGAIDALRQIKGEAAALGASMMKVSENVNRNAEQNAERLKKRIAELNVRLQAAQRIQQFGNGEAIAKADQNLTAARTNLAAASERLTQAEGKLANAQHAATVASNTQVHATEQLAKAQQELAAHEQAMALLQDRLAARKDTTSTRAKESAQRQIEASLQKQVLLTKKVQEAEEALTRAQKTEADQLQIVATIQKELPQILQQQATATKAVQQADLALTQAKKEEASATQVVNTLLKQLTVAERTLRAETAQIINTSYKAATGFNLFGDSLSATGKDANTFTGQLRQMLLHLQDSAHEATTAGRYVVLAGKDLMTAMRSVGSLRTQLAAGSDAWRTYAQATRQLGVINGNLGPSFASLVRNLAQAVTTGTSWRQVALNIGHAAANLGSASAASVRSVAQLGLALGSLGGAGAKVVGGLGKIIAEAGRAVGALSKLRSSSQLVGAAFASTGTHIGGIAVRLQGAQLGLYSAGGALTGFGEKGKQVFSDLLTVAGDFEQKIITIGAVLGHAAEQAKGPLRELAVELGKLTMFSPNDAADVMSELVKGGISLNDILGKTVDTVGEHGEKVTKVLNSAAKAVLDMAAASGEPIDAMSRAIISATNIWANMGLEATDASNIIVKVANASAASVGDLTGGMKNAGAVAAIMGVQFKQTMLALGALSNAGLKGPEGGTALRYFLLNLIPSTQKSIELMKEKNLLIFQTQTALKELAGSGQQFEQTQESMLDALYRKYTDGTKSFTQAIEDEDTTVNKFQQYLVRQGIVHSEFVDEKTGELKDMADILQRLHDMTKDMQETDAVKLMSSLFGERGGSKGAAPFLIAFRKNLSDYEEKRKAGKLTAVDDANVIRALQKEMETYGSAEDIAAERTKGFAGSLEYLQSSLEGLKILLGEPLLAPMASLLRTMGDLVNKAADWAQANPEVVKMVGTILMLGTGFAALAGPLTILAAAWPYFISGLTGLALAAAPLTLLVGGLAAVMYGLYQAVADPNSGLGPALKNTATLLQVTLPEAMKAAMEVFHSSVGTMGKDFSQFLVQTVLPGINKLIVALPDLIRQVGGFIQGTLVPTARTLVQVFAIVGQAVLTVAQTYGPTLINAFNRIRAIALPVVLAVAHTFAVVLPTAVRLAVLVFYQVLLPVLSTLARIFVQTILPVIRQLADWLGRELPPILRTFGLLWQQVIGPALEEAARIVASLFTKLMDLWSSVSVWLLPVLDYIIRDTVPKLVFAFQVVEIVVKLVIGVVRTLSDLLGGIVKGVAEFFGVAKKGGEGVKAGLKDGLGDTHKLGRDTGKSFTDELAAGLADGKPGVHTAASGLGDALSLNLETSGNTSGQNYLAGLLAALGDGGNQKKVQDAGKDLSWLLSAPETTQAAASRAIDKYTQQALDDAAMDESLRTRMAQTGETLADLLGEQRVQDRAKDNGALITLRTVEGAVEAVNSPDVQAALARVGAQAVEVLSVTAGHTIESGVPTVFDVAMKTAAGHIVTQQVPFWSETGQRLVNQGLASPEVVAAANKVSADLFTQWVQSGTKTLTEQQSVILNATLTALQNGTASDEVVAAAEKHAGDIMAHYVFGAEKTLTSDEMKLVLAVAGVDNAGALQDPAVLEKLRQSSDRNVSEFVGRFVADMQTYQPDVMNAAIVLAASADNENSRLAAANAGATLGNIVAKEYANRLGDLRSQTLKEMEALGAAKAARQEAEDLLATKQGAYANYYNQKELAKGRDERIAAAQDIRDLRNEGKQNLQAGRTAAAKAKIAAGTKTTGGTTSTGSSGGPNTPYDKNTLGGKDSGGGGGSTTKRTPAEEAADVAKKIADAIKDGTEALRRISGFSIPPNLAAKAKEFAEAVAMLVMAFQTVSLRFKEDAMKHTEAFAETAGKSVDVVGKTLDSFAKFKDYVAPTKGSLLALVDMVDFTVQAFSQVANRYKVDALAQLDIYADSAGKAVDLVGKAADSLMKADEFIAPAESSIAAVVASADKTVQLMIPLAASYGPETLDILSAYSDSLGKGMDALGKAADFLIKLQSAEVTFDGAEAKARLVVDHAQALAVLLRTLVTSQGWTDDAANQMGVYADNVGKVMDSLSKAADLINKLNDPKLNLAPVLTKAQELVNQSAAIMQMLLALVDDKGRLPGWTAKNVAAVGTFADATGKVADALDKALTFLTNLGANKTALAPLADRVRELVNAAQHMMNTLGPLTAGWEGFTDNISTFADATGKVSDSLGKTLDFLSNLAGNKVAFRNLADRVQELVNATADIMARIRTAVPKDYADDNLTAYSDAATKTAGTLSAVYDLLAKLGQKTKLGNLSQVQDLAGQVVALFQAYKAALVAAGQGLTETGAETDALAAQVADDQSKVVSLLSSVFDLWAKAGAAAKPKTDPGTIIQTVLRFLLDTVRQFRTAREAFAEAVDQETADLAELVGKTVSGLAGAMDLFDKLDGYTGTSRNRIDLFIAALRYTVQRLQTLPGEIAPEMLDLAQQFGEKLGPAFDLLGSALQFFIALTGEEETTDDGKKTKNKTTGGLRPVDPAAIGHFIESLKILIRTLRDGLLNEVAPETLALAEEFGQKMGPAIDTIGKALDIFLKIQGDGKDNSGLAPIDPDAIGAVVGSIYLMLHHWRNVITGGEFQDDFAERSEAFAAQVSRVLEVIERVLSMVERVSKLNVEGGEGNNLGAIMEQLRAAMESVSTIQVPQLQTGMTGALDAIAQASQTDLGTTAAAFSQTFADIREDLAFQVAGKDETSLIYLWSGKDPKKSLLYRMWFALEGKAGFRPVIRLAFAGLWADLQLQFDNEGSNLALGWEGLMQRMAKATQDAIDSIKAALAGLPTDVAVTTTVGTGTPNVKMATGGVVTKPTIALIGEGNEPEAVVPLSRAREMGFGGSGETNIFNIRTVQTNRVTDITKQRRRAQALADPYA